MREPGRVIVFAPNWLGDAVMALPALADLRRHVPRARLMVAARPSVAGLFTMVPEVDEVLTLQWRGQPLGPAALRRDAARLRQADADVAVLLPNSFASALLASRARIPERWGYARDLRSALLTKAVPRPAPGLHQGRYYQHLLEALGIPNGPFEARIVVGAEAGTRARELLREAGWDGERPIVVVAPGAAYGTAKRWLPSHFARLIGDLVAKDGAQCVLVGSPADADSVRLVRQDLPACAQPHVADLCGRTSLETLAGVMAHARVCVSNDSGAMHLAAAAGVPLAAIFGPTNERETAPIPRPGVPARLLLHQVACRPCMLRECPIDHPCMRELEPARVLAAVREMLT